MNAYECWSTVDPPWRAAFELAWQAFRAGGAGVGAVLTDASGDIIGRGRNERFTAPGGALLAHAEMAVLSALPGRPGSARTTTLHTTLHPCPMCLGAAVVARVAQVRFAVHDPTWSGIERLPELNDEVRRRWPLMTGPLPGPLAEWAAVLPCLNTRGSLLRATAAAVPERVRLAAAVTDRLGAATVLPGTCGEALELVGDLLPGGAGRADRSRG